MPRGCRRGGYRGNSHRGSPRGRGLGVQSSGNPTPRKGFTLADEARNTEELHQSWTPERQLRYNKINFVSAGHLSKPDEKEAESAMAHMRLDSPPTDQEDTQDKPRNFHVQVELEDEDNSGTTDTLDFVIDTHGDQNLITSLPPPRIRSPSPNPSNSSEEVILFGGRDNNGNGILRSAQGSERAPSANSFDARIRLVEDRIHVQEELLEETLHEGRLKDTPRGKSRPPPDDEVIAKPSPPADPSDGFEPVVSGCRNRRGRSRRKQKATEEDAILADYLANIDSDDKELLALASGFNARELGGTDDDAWQETGTSSEEPRTSRAHLKGGWDSHIEDLDDLSTSDGVMGEVQGIFSKRERPSGVQYLVVWEDQTMDDARWVLETTLTSVIAQAHIEAFEVEEKLVARFAAVSGDDDEDDDDSSTDEENLTDEDAEDEEDLLRRKIERMDDEQTARLLAKQEELGMGSNELLLFDDAADGDEEDGFAPLNRNFNPFMLPQKKARSKRPKGEFPPAAALADAYDGFDVMDFERPSLKKKPKGGKGKLILDDVDDSELEESMQAAWDNDRIKKKERKQERERLRAQGLLGSKNGKPDLKQKYKEGMGIGAIKDEVKTFLLGSNTTLALPPMDKAYRKIVHDIANSFKLKSKSVGDGQNRAPVLYRTARTTKFIERTWATAENRTNRYLPRGDVGKSSGAKKGGRSSGGFNSTAVSYRDGDVVGASAAALGAENRGRAMLEKMGWSHGTALGALNNKGILEPVSHVVKTTRAGLG